MTSKARIFPCNTCSLTFETSELQRSHMRQSWQRRVAGLPAVSEEQFHSENKSQEVVPQQKDSNEQRKERASSPNTAIIAGFIIRDLPAPDHGDLGIYLPTSCLFCNLDSHNLDANVNHMSSLHGLFIPSPDQLSDMQSFLGYLATIIFGYKECLYCGQEKGTIDGVQTHMRDKGHCMINVNADSELLDFWELSESENEDQSERAESPKKPAIKLSENEMRLPSGAVINSRSDTTQIRTRPSLAQSRIKGSQYRIKRDEMKALMVGEDQETADGKQGKFSQGNDHRVTVRGELGLVGVPESQRRALQITEHKMKRREAVATAAQRHAIERQPVKTIYYKTENPVYQAG